MPREKMMLPLNIFTDAHFPERHGLLTATNVINFLKSPANTSLEKIIKEELTGLQVIENCQHHLKKEANRYFILALFYLAILHKKHTHARHLNQEIQLQIDTLLKNKQEQHHKIEHEATTDSLRHSLTSYAWIAENLHHDLGHQLQQQATLETSLIDLEKQEQRLNQRDVIFAKHLHALDEHFAMLDKQEGPENQLKFINEYIANLNQSIDKLAENAAILVEHTEAQHGCRGDSAGEIFHKEEITSLMNELNGAHLQLAHFKNAIAVLNKEKKLYNEEGQITPSFREMSFILSKNQKLIKQNGKFYLLRPHQTFDALNSEEKTVAQHNFETQKHEIIATKKLLPQNKRLESTSIFKEKNDLIRKFTLAKNKTQELADYLLHIQTARANITLLLNQLVPSPTNASRLITSKLTAQLKKPSISPSTVQAYRFFRDLTVKPSPNTVEEFKIMMRALTKNPSVLKELNKLEAGKPIQPQTLQFLLKYMHQFGGTITSIKEKQRPEVAAHSNWPPKPKYTPY